MKKIAVVHYMPLEYYPPVTNFLDVAAPLGGWDIKVFSTKNNKNRKIYQNPRLSKVYRSSLPQPGEKSVVRLFKYLKFNVSCLLQLILFNPEEILYYESYSAGPVYWYIKFFSNNTRLHIHYHEYSSPEWYKNGMQLVKIYHDDEKNFLYQKAHWISQTNKERIDLFLKDNPEVNGEKMRILPNYPPDSWSKIAKSHRKENKRLNTVYIGSLSLEST